MTGDHSRLMNFVKKFIGTVRFGNDHFGAIMGYGDYVISNSVISRVYYVEGLGRNLFFVSQFCDSDLEVAFRKHSCYVHDTDDVELLKGSCGSNLYTISVEYIMKSSLICLLSKASKKKSWLWHRRLNHLNFGTINDLARKDLVRGLPRLEFEKDHLCSAPAPNLLTPGPISSGLVPNLAPAIPYVPPTNKELEMLFQPMFDEYFNPPGIRLNPIPVIPTAGVPSAEVNPFTAADPEPFVNEFAPVDNSEASSSVNHGLAGGAYVRKVNRLLQLIRNHFVNVVRPRL
ncbi:retrovirus-related pol polyprotein from transposon TNT 1-94 [Tanacetum coccineum]